MNKITIELTEDQVIMLIGELEMAIYQDDNDQTRAFKYRTKEKLLKDLNKLAKAKS